MVVIVWFVIKLDRRGKLLGGSVFRLAVEILASRAHSRQPDRLAQLKNPKTIHFLNGFSSAMAPALRGAGAPPRKPR